MTMEAPAHPREPEATRRDECSRYELGLHVAIESGQVGGEQRFDYLTPSPKPGGTVPMRHATALTLHLILDPQASPPQNNPVRSIHRFTLRRSIPPQPQDVMLDAPHLPP